MIDREKIIKGLERCLKHTCPAVGSKEYLECEYTMGLYCRQDMLLRDTLALLKAQEPRVMTLEEVQVSDNPVWLEGGLAGGTWAMMPFMREYSIEFVADGVCTVYPAFAINEYKKTWRCWTARPTNEQREATPWEL